MIEDPLENRGTHLARSEFLKNPIRKAEILRNNIYVLGGKWFQYREAFLSKSEHCSGTPKLLDAGSGNAWIKSEFDRFDVPVDYYGIDLGVGDENVKYNLSSLADLHSIPFKSETFDKVTSNSVLEHVEHPDQCFSEMARVLVPGGRIFLSVPLSFALHQRPYDYHRFTKHILEKYAERNNLKIIELWPQGGIFTVLRYIHTNYTLGSINDSVLWKSTVGVLSKILKVIDRTIGAPAVYLLDKFDRKKDLTLGYFVIYEKIGAAKDTGSTKAQFRCPECSDDEAILTQELKCLECETDYERVHGIPNLVLKNSFSPRSKKLNLVS